MKKLFTLLLWVAGLGVYAQPQEFRGFNLNTDMNPNHHSFPRYFTVANGKMLFSAQNVAAGAELWISDGTTAGTQMLKDINPGANASSPFQLVEMNGKIYFSATNGAIGAELWVSDGTSTGTTLVKEINPGAGGSSMNHLTIFNGKIYFGANDGTSFELWASDGTSAGTQMIKDLNPGAGNGNPAQLFVFNGKLYFNATDGTNGRELWVTDGTSAGTQMLKDIHPTPAQNGDPVSFTEYNGKLYFYAGDGTSGRELWVSDGTSAGTQMVKDIRVGLPSGAPAGIIPMTVFNGKLYFIANDGVAGRELWMTDGTSAGTQLLKDINPGLPDASPSDLCVYKNKLYFFATDGVNGKELWETDGTSAGTVMLKDIYPGATGSSGSNAFVYKNFMYFAAEQTATDMHLFVTDGTAANTKIVAPVIAPNANPVAGANEFVMYDSTIYFAAAYNSDGQELWAMEDTTTYPNSVKETKKAITFSLLPNPAHDNFTIKINTHFNHGTMQLTDLSGKLIQVQELKNGTQDIPLKGIAPGIYTVTVRLDDKQSTQRLVVE